MNRYSISPKKEKFQLPDQKRTEQEIQDIHRKCEEAKRKGKEIVIIQGLGFVGAVMAAVVADSEVDGRLPYFVIGFNRPSISSFWKIPIINKGLCPFKAKDPEIKKIFHRTVTDRENLIATWVPEVFSDADILIVDINLDVVKPEFGNAKKSVVEIQKFSEAIIEIGNRIDPACLVLIETTVPPGTVEHVVQPLLEKCFIRRGIDIVKNPPLIAHSYERVMPGERYIQSIKNIWRTYSATSELAKKMTKKLLANIIDTHQHPLFELPNPTSSELAKILENSYRAMNIAFIYEWTLFAEDIGINLFEIVDSIKVRRGTHDNMMYPGFGVGGYCLTKDPFLAEWASNHFFKRDQHLNFSIEAININDLMPRHTFDLLREGMNFDITGKKIAVLGASYRKDIDDTRNSPTITLYDDITNAQGIPYLHDPYSTMIEQRRDILIHSNLDRVLEQADAIIFVVDHQQYLRLSIRKMMLKISKNACILDAFNVLSDPKIKLLKKHGFRVLGVGKGHIKDL
jgi:UDP-N-acetyl-D-glucosamine dehydrogenase